MNSMFADPVLWVLLLILGLHESVAMGILTRISLGKDRSMIFWGQSLVWERITGIVVLGGGPLLLLFFTNLNVAVSSAVLPQFTFQSVFLLILLGALIMAFASWWFPKMKLQQFHSPLLDIRSYQKWVLPNVILWVCYLAAYEWIMRGLILYASVAWVGQTTAIVLNCILYALIHVHKGRNQVVGALPFGFVLCWITLETGSFWAAYLLHLILTLSMEWHVFQRIKALSERRSVETSMVSKVE